VTPSVESNSLAALSTDDYPSVVALAGHLLANDADGTFEFGLDCMIGGLERRAADFGSDQSRRQ
jgi:hypothetical protein